MASSIFVATNLLRALSDAPVATGYHHAGLAAVLVNPTHVEVFPPDFEPIFKQDGAVKNDM